MKISIILTLLYQRETKSLKKNNKVLTEKVDDIENEKEKITHELERFKDKLNNTERKWIIITIKTLELGWRGEIEKMMHGECPFCEIKFKKMTTRINHYNIKHGGSCPPN